MAKTGNHLTDKAQKWAMDLLLNEGFADKDNPFFHPEAGGMILMYDEIRITNFSKVDGVGVDVNYYWKGWKCCVFPVNNMSLDMAPALNSLNLNGIAGSMKIEIVEGCQIT